MPEDAKEVVICGHKPASIGQISAAGELGSASDHSYEAQMLPISITTRQLNGQNDLDYPHGRIGPDRRSRWRLRAPRSLLPKP
jgi:hypothetical protein